MANIYFYSEKTLFKLQNPKKTANWLIKVSQKEQRPIESLIYVFCSDAQLSKMNEKYLHHSTLTDILSFDYSDSNAIQGEIYISIPRVRDNARKFKQVFETELRRVLVHGLLHFLGYKDKSPYQKAQMRIKEEACLSLWK